MLYIKSWQHKYNNFKCFDIHSEIEDMFVRSIKPRLTAVS